MNTNGNDPLCRVTLSKMNIHSNKYFAHKLRKITVLVVKMCFSNWCSKNYYLNLKLFIIKHTRNDIYRNNSFVLPIL